ncbi:MAG: hypothetical protein H7839_13655 [Magnetococcus sp. YQC-5]
MNSERLQYRSNPKHKEPWQPGRKGALCPAWSHSLADELLQNSEPHPNFDKKARYATSNGMAFEAYPDLQGGGMVILSDGTRCPTKSAING